MNIKSPILILAGLAVAAVFWWGISSQWGGQGEQTGLASEGRDLPLESTEMSEPEMELVPAAGEVAVVRSEVPVDPFGSQPAVPIAYPEFVTPYEPSLASVMIRVLDEDKVVQPMFRLRVSLLRKKSDVPDFRHQWSYATDVEGRCIVSERMDHSILRYDEKSGEDVRPEPKVLEWENYGYLRIEPAMPIANLEPMYIPLQPLPKRTYELVVPTMGSMRIRLVDGAGEPFVTRVLCHLIDPETGATFQKNLTFTESGLIGQIPLDRAWQIQVDPDNRWPPVVYDLAVLTASDPMQSQTILIEQPWPKFTGTAKLPSGEPLPFTELYFTKSDGGREMTRTGKDGTFQFFSPGLAGQSGTLLAKVRSPQVDYSGPILFSGARQTDVKDLGVIELQPLRVTVEGHIEGYSRLGVASLDLGAGWKRSNGSGFDARSLEIGPDGKFTIKDVPLYVLLMIGHTVVEGGAEPHVVVANPMHRIEPGKRLSLRVTAPAQWAGSLIADNPEQYEIRISGAGYATRIIAIDGAGEFDVEGLAPGVVNVAVVPKGSIAPKKTIHNVRLIPGPQQNPDLLQIFLP